MMRAVNQVQLPPLLFVELLKKRMRKKRALMRFKSRHGVPKFIDQRCNLRTGIGEDKAFDFESRANPARFHHLPPRNPPHELSQDPGGLKFESIHRPVDRSHEMTNGLSQIPLPNMGAWSRAQVLNIRQHLFKRLKIEFASLHLMLTLAFFTPPIPSPRLR